ncbi:MAG TPA: lysylphosphatidylglycerol synthase domain-containing protein [Thermoleophilaceae bacterium]|nr:lysylphosphatidylglycerol synthase domain-containing protein [Thermoleophilaceae bacterium]
MADSSSTDPERPPLLHRAGAAAASIGSLGQGRPKLRAAIQWGLIALVFACLALFLITQWNKLPNYDWRFRPGWLVVAFALLGVFYLLQPTLWIVILGGLGERADATELRAAWAKSLIARYVPTSALMVVGRVVLSERAGITGRVALASIVYELALGVNAAVIGGAYFFIKLPSLQHHDIRYAVLLVVPIALIALHPRIFKPVTDWALGKLGREPLPQALPYSLVLLLVPAYLMGWLMVGAGLFTFALALQPLPVDKLPYIATAYPVAFGVSVLTFILPSGLGTRDATLATALDAVLPLTVATAIAVAFRIFQTAVELMFVGLLVLLARLKRDGDREHPGAERQGGELEPAVAGDRGKREQPEDVPRD